jgi:hypothetical protein
MDQPLRPLVFGSAPIVAVFDPVILGSYVGRVVPYAGLTQGASIRAWAETEAGGLELLIRGGLAVVHGWHRTEAGARAAVARDFRAAERVG